VLVGSVIYTLGELTGGPVTSALAAEAAPEHLRGRYLSMIQLAWNLSGTVTPVAFAWLLDRGETPLWFVMLGLTVVGVGISTLLGRVLPLADEPVTNAAVAAAEDGLAAVEHER
jgi:MFS family permease